MVNNACSRHATPIYPPPSSPLLGSRAQEPPPSSNAHGLSLAPAVRNEHGAPSPAGSCIGINAESSGAHASECVRRATRSGLPPQAVMWWEYAVVGIRPPMNRDSLRRVWHGTASARPPTLRPPHHPLKRRARRGVAEGHRARFRRENPEDIPARLPQVGDAFLRLTRLPLTYAAVRAKTEREATSHAKGRLVLRPPPPAEAAAPPLRMSLQSPLAFTPVPV